MFKKYMKKVLAFSLAAAMAFSGAQIAGVGGADTASAAVAIVGAVTGDVAHLAVDNASVDAVAEYLIVTKENSSVNVPISYAKKIMKAKVMTPKNNPAISVDTTSIDETNGTTNPTIVINTSGKVVADLAGSPNVWLSLTDEDGASKDVKFYVTTEESFQYNTSLKKDMVDIDSSTASTNLSTLANTTAGLKAYNTDAITAGVLPAITTYTYDLDDTLAKALVNAADGSKLNQTGLASTTNVKVASGTADGTKGTLTVNIPEIKDANDKVVVAKATKTITVRITSKVDPVAGTAATVYQDASDNYTLPFAAFISKTEGVKASVMDSSWKALSETSPLVGVDNDKKEITIKKGTADGSTVNIQFTPADTEKQGDPVKVTLTLETTADTTLGKTNSTLQKGAKKDSVVVDSGNANSFALKTARAFDDYKVSLAFKDDAVRSKFTVMNCKDAAGAPGAEAATGDDIAHVVVGAPAGIPAGTYPAYLMVQEKAGTKYITVEEVSVIVKGSSKDKNFTIAKVDGATVKGANGTDPASPTNKLTTVNIVSGKTTKLSVASELSVAGVVKNLVISDIRIEKPTGERVTDGFKAEGMDIICDGNAVKAGESYILFIKTKGDNIDESDAEKFTVTVKKGYGVKYDFNGGNVKDKKEVAEVALSSSGNIGAAESKIKLEDGSNIEYVGATFEGWAYKADATKADFSADKCKNALTDSDIKNLLDNVSGDVVTLYGVWSFTTYTLTYDANGGTATTPEAAKTFTVKSTDVAIPTTGYVKTTKPLIGWTTTASGKTAAGGTLPVYNGANGVLNAAQLQAIVKEVDSTAKKTDIKLYAQYGAALKSITIAPETLALGIGETGKITATALDEDGKVATLATITFKSDDPGVANVDEAGNITAVAAGTANIAATASLGGVELTSTNCVVTVTKASNTITVKGKTATVKYGKKVTLKVSKVLTIKKAKGTKTFVKKSGKTQIKINKKTGKVTVKKGLKKGTYKVKVTVKAAGNDTYKAKSVTKTFKIKVK